MNRIKNYQKTYTVTTVDSKQATTVLVQYTPIWLYHTRKVRGGEFSSEGRLAIY